MKILLTAKITDPDVIRTLDNPYSESGGLAVLFGNLAVNGSIVKSAAVDKDMLVHKGPAVIYNSQDEALRGN